MQWFTRKRNAHEPSGSGVLVVVAAAVALLSVAGLARQAWTALEYQRTTEARLRNNVATIAARGVTSRVRSLIANRAVTVAELLRGRNRAELAKHARAIVDSLAACECQTPVRIDRITIVDRDARDIELSLDQEPAIYYRAPASAHVLVPIARHDDLVADVQFAPNALTREILPFVIDSLSGIVPAVLTGSDDNASAFAITLTEGTDTLFSSEPVYPPTYSRRISLFETGTLMLSAAANPFLAVSTTPLPSPRSTIAVIATMLAVLASTALAVRSVQLASARSAFTAAVSHELRTPLTEIMLYAELVESGRAGTDADVTQAAGLIRAEAQRLHQMVDNVLHVSRNGRDGFVVASRAQRVATSLQATVDGFAPIAAQNGSRISLEVVDDPEVAVDASAVRQVVLNLLDNAIRYGPDNQHIIVRLRRDRTSATIEVDDAGPGVPLSDRSRLFEPYVRLTRDLTRARSGTGLGLSVVRTLVNAMGGQVQLTDSPRGGLLVRVQLPAISAAA